ncbi:hypothetical protein PYW08_013075 [Mythimna loreyi]|uniref:Uncharacterized protein n=1 Tax=Mythimna loreyi TaxID=667449 RepID=A0ACC2Q2L3_9NEOP|nr:hypothetical protein PYW08_013075 [Mythimna loreyi]
MASPAIGQVGVEKLKGAENYSTWKFTMRMLLIHEELWDCVEAEPKVDCDKKKVDKALARIALSVTPAVIPYIRTAKSAHEAWKILQKGYEGRGLSRRLGLLRSLFSTKLSENSSMEIYLNKIKEFSHQLNEIESPLDDEFVAVIMLSGLTDDYDPLIMAIEHSTTTLSTDIISEKLLQETQRREEKTEGIALITQKQPKCFGCGARGHMIRNCPKKIGTAKVQNQGNDPPTQKKPVKKSARKNKALLTALAVKVNSDVWCIDSGATNHMCNSDKVMVKCNRSKSVDVNIANGERLSTAGLGEVQINLKDCVRTISDTYYVPNLSTNLLSVSAMTKKGYVVTFNSNSCTIYDNDEILATGTQVNGIYQLDTVSDNGCAEEQECTMMASAAVDSSSQELWHRRLGHLNSRSMQLLQKGTSQDMWNQAPENDTRLSTTKWCCRTRQQDRYGEGQMSAARCWTRNEVLGRGGQHSSLSKEQKSY